MIVQLKEMESRCLEYAKRFEKNWEYFCLVKDAWLNGFNAAKAEANIISGLNHHVPEFTDGAMKYLGDEVIEVEIGNPQIGQGLRTLTKEEFKTEMKRYYNCNDIRVTEENGLISFQGTIR